MRFVVRVALAAQGGEASREKDVLNEMSFGDGVWKLLRTAGDFSPLELAQRYTGAVSDDGRSIRGTWDLSTDGSRWEHDFELSYSKIS